MTCVNTAERPRASRVRLRAIARTVRNLAVAASVIALTDVAQAADMFDDDFLRGAFVPPTGLKSYDRWDGVYFGADIGSSRLNADFNDNVHSLLADFLRHTLGLTGTHVGCEHGVCGACTVLVDGDSARACLMFAVQADRRSIETVESLGRIGAMNRLQEAFHEHHALQCGFCTPGMLMTATDLMRKYSLTSDDDIREGLSGNLCRCTGYEHVIKAIRAVVDSEAGNTR